MRGEAEGMCLATRLLLTDTARTRVGSALALRRYGCQVALQLRKLERVIGTGRCIARFPAGQPWLRDSSAARDV